MTLPKQIRAFSFQLLLLLSIMFGWQTQASADTFGDFVWLLGQVESSGIMPKGFPKSQDIANSKDLITCLGNIKGGDKDLQALDCINTFKDTPVGKKAMKEVSGGSFPSWFWKLIDVYVDLRTSNYTGLVTDLGEAAICFIAQVLTEGTVDVCGLIKELVELAEDMYDSGKAIAAFIVNLGKKGWEGVKAIGCGLGLGGCDKGDPPLVYVYNVYFHPQLKAGVDARNAVSDNEFPNLLVQLKSKAKELKLPGTNKQWFSNSIIDQAAQLYTTNVNVQWSAWVVTHNSAMKDKRNSYNTANNIATAAKEALAVYAGSGTPAETTVVDRCTNDLHQKYGLAYVDRWIDILPGDAFKYKFIRGNKEWCTEDFWRDNLDQFAADFGPALKKAGCTASGSGFKCGQMPAYEMCSDLLSASEYYSPSGFSNHKNTHCSLDKQSAMQQVAKEILDALASKRCTLNGTAVSCTRPWKSDLCKKLVLEKQKQYYQSTFTKIDVTCPYTPDKSFTDFSMMVDAAFKKVNKGASVSAPNKKGSFSYDYCTAEHDPLSITCKDANTFPELQAAFPPNIKLKKCPPDPNDDGADVPCYQGPWSLKSSNGPLKAIADHKIGSAANAAGRASNERSGGLARVQDQSSAVLPPSIGFARHGNEAPQRGIASANSGNGADKHQARPAPTPGLKRIIPSPHSGTAPDITTNKGIEVGNIQTVWGTVARIDGGAGKPSRDGLCVVPVRYSLRNIGSAPSPVFHLLWQSSATQKPIGRRIPILHPDQSYRDTLSVGLKQGRNFLSMVIDDTGQVFESNENNNRFRLIAELTGSCGKRNRVIPSAPLPDSNVRSAPAPLVLPQIRTTRPNLPSRN